MKPLEPSVAIKLSSLLGLSEMPCACLCYLYFLSSMKFRDRCAILDLTLAILPVEMRKYPESGNADFFGMPRRWVV